MGALDNIRNGMISHWPLDDATGQPATDFIGSNDLTQNNSPVNVAGKIGDGKDFEVASSQDYTITDAAQSGLEFNPNTTSFTVSVWANLESKTQARIIFAKTDPGGNQYDMFYASGPDQFGWELHGTLLNSVYATSFGSPSTGVFNHVLFWWDHVAQKMKIRVNGGTINETAKTGTLNTGGTGSVTVGCFFSPGKTLFFDGILDELTVWQRVLTEDEMQAVAAGVDLTSQFFSCAFDASADFHGRLGVNEAFMEAGFDASADFTSQLVINQVNFSAAFDADAGFSSDLTKADKLLVADLDASAELESDATVERALASDLDASADFTVRFVTPSVNGFVDDLLMCVGQMGPTAGRAQVPGLSANIASPPQWQAEALFDLADTYTLPLGEPTGAAPLAAAATMHNGCELAVSLPGAWFDKLWVFPTSVDAGFVTSAQLVEFEVYSSFLYDAHSLDTLINNVDSGITTIGLPGLPAALAPQAGFTFTAQVSADGPATIAGTLDFNFDLYSILVPFTGSRIRLFSVEPLAPMTERLTWATDVIRKSVELEQRISGRNTPRQEFDLTYSLDGLDRQVFEALLFDHHGRIFSMPVWSEPIELSADATMGSNTVQVATTAYADIRVGGNVALWESAQVSEVLTVQSFTPTTITFTTALTADHAKAETWGYPARVGYVTGPASGSKLPEVLQTYRFTFRAIDNTVDLADAGAFPTFNGRPLIDEPNWVLRGTTPAALERRQEVVDGEVGGFVLSAEAEVDRDTGNKRWLTTTRQRLWEVRQLLHYLKGRQGSFYIPTFSRDMTPVADLTSGSSLLNIARFGYTDFVQTRAPRDAIWIRLTDGSTIVRSVVAAVNLTDTTEQLTVSSPWSSTIETADIDRISFLQHARLQSDAVTINHKDARGNASIDGPLISVLE